MLSEIEIKGFKTLRDVKIPLQPGINVFVGANNSGKSNALGALRLLAESVGAGSLQMALQAVGGFDAVVARKQSSMSLAVTGHDEAGRLHYQITEGTSPPVHHERAEADGSWWDNLWGAQAMTSHGPKFSVMNHGGLLRPLMTEDAQFLSAMGSDGARLGAFGRWLAGMNIIDLAIPSLRAEATPDSTVTLGPDGLNIAAVLDLLANSKPTLFESIEAEVRRAAKEIKHLKSPIGSAPGTKVVGVQEQDEVYKAAEISDGLLLFIGITTAVQIAGSAPSLIAIEEPERGVHPRRLRELVDQLRRLARRGTQVVLTTHSPQVLDEFKDTPESVVVFERDDTGTHVQRLVDHPNWMDDLMRDKPLGDLWYSGVLGGVPK